MCDIEGIKERLKLLKNNSGLTTEELAKLSDVPIGTLNKFFGNQTKEPSVKTIIKLAKTFDVSVDYIINGAGSMDNLYNDDEIEFINNYKKLNEHDRSIVDYVIKLGLNVNSQDEKQKPGYKQIKKYYSAILYDFPVSAGTGERPDATNASIVEIEEEPPRGTDYILRIAGNSMEPEYGDGDYVYVESTTRLNFGDVGIFAYEGSTYMKLYTESGLKSLNPDYALIQGEDIHILGKVLGVVEGDITYK